MKEQVLNAAPSHQKCRKIVWRYLIAGPEYRTESLLLQNIKAKTALSGSTSRF
jgi:hypothetical protein